MNAFRKLLSLFALLLLTGCAVFLLGEKRVLSLTAVLRDGWDDTRYEAVSVGPGEISVAASLTGDTLRLVHFTLKGEKLDERSVTLEDEDGGTVAALYCFHKDLSFVAIYDMDARYLSFYRISAAGEPERMFHESCVGETFNARKNDTRILGISQDGDRISIALLKKGNVYSYSCAAYFGNLLENVVKDTGMALLNGNVSTGAILQDGSLALGGKGALVLSGRATAAAAQGQFVTRLTRRNAGLYFLDAATMWVWYSDLTGADSKQLIDLSNVVKGHCVTDLSVSAKGEVLLLLDGKTLVLAGEDGSEYFSDILYPSRKVCLGIFSIYGFTTLGVVLLVWYALSHLQMPLAFYWGSVLAAVTLAAILILEYVAIRPMGELLSIHENLSATEAVMKLALWEYPSVIDESLLCHGISHVLEKEDRGNVMAIMAHLTADGWYLADGSRAELNPAFEVSLGVNAIRHGEYFEQDAKVFRYSYPQNDWVFFVSMSRTPNGSIPSIWLFSGLLIVAAAAALILIRINADVRLLSTKMEKVEQGGGHNIRLRTGDELQSMSSALSGLAEAMARQIRERETVERAYRRFVPERVLNLLGKRTINEVDKNTFTSGRMSVMKVWFTFPDYMYDGAADNRILFNSINEVIERTASIAEQRGGTVFNFAHNGYEVVMKQDSAQLVSTAVAMEQEVISLNASRVERDLPEVTFRIALDVGNVIIGIVGDSEQMEPTTISSSFSTVRMLIRLANQLEAGILCTEAIADGAKGYGSRYLGKAPGEPPQRVYEIFDADDYDVRKGKSATVKPFLQGVFALYSGDRAQAKHIFLRLAHDYPGDGAVRYYLYLADRMEANPGAPCELSPGKEN